MIIKSTVISLFLFSASCATPTQSTFLGMGIGSVVGGGLGAAIGSQNGKPRTGAAIGAAAGAGIGGLAGWLEHKKMGNGKSQSQFHTPSHGETPFLNMPEVRKIWVPDRIEGERFESGHWIYIIDRNSTWRLDDKSKSETKNNGTNGN